MEKIELSDKHLKLRLVGAALFLIVGASALAYALTTFLRGDAGWREISVNIKGTTVAEDFVFMYNVGVDGSVSKETRALAEIYSAAAKNAYEQFTVDTEIANINNLWYINRHPNEEIEVDPLLYGAFEKISESGNRLIYLAPAYEIYDNIFYLPSADGAVDYDPMLNPEVGEFFSAVCGYANDADKINVELLGDNKLRLNVSADYLKFAENEEIVSFVDFYYLKNAFICDYIADEISAAGYSRGTVSSLDGYVRNLDGSGEIFGLNIYHLEGRDIYPAAVMTYSGAKSFVSLRSYPISEDDVYRYLELGDGSVRSQYLCPENATNLTSLPELTLYSDALGCADILLKALPVYIADDFDEAVATRLKSDGIDVIYAENSEIRHTDSELTLSNVFQTAGKSFTVKQVK